MDIFGKKTAELKERLEAAHEEIGRLKAELGQARQRADASAESRRAVEAERDKIAAALAEAEQARDRARSAQAKAEQMVKWLEEQQARATAAAKAAAEEATRRREEAEARAAEAVAEAARLRREVDEARAEAAKAQAARAAGRPRPDPERSLEAAAKGTGDVAALKAEIDSLRRALAENAEKLRVALRKAEHNRRAYIVTLHQLDMAEDRIHILTHGTPRPVHVDRGVEQRGPVEAEDVEGFEEGSGAQDGAAEVQGAAKAPAAGAAVGVPAPPAGQATGGPADPEGD